MGKLVGAAVVALLAMTVGLVTVAAVGGASGSTGSGAGGDRGESAGSSGGGSGGGGGPQQPAIPPDWLTLYQKAAATCPGLPWSVVAAIGTVETGSGQSSAPGVWSGANPAGAEGPMQFEPATFAAYATVGPGGARPPSPYDPVDAVYSAATMLCTDGAGSAATLRDAVDDYNHSAAYVDTVLTLSLSFQQDPTTPGTVVAALSFAARQLGTPYLWGGTGVGWLRLLGVGPGCVRPRRCRPPPGGPGPVRHRAVGSRRSTGGARGPGLLRRQRHRRGPCRDLRRRGRDDRRPPHRCRGPVRRCRLVGPGGGHPAGLGRWPRLAVRLPRPGGQSPPSWTPSIASRRKSASYEAAPMPMAGPSPDPIAVRERGVAEGEDTAVGADEVVAAAAGWSVHRNCDGSTSKPCRRRER